MRSRFQSCITMITAAALVYGVSLSAGQTTGQAPAYKARRTADGKPDLNGIWQAMTTANWDIQDHEARPGPAALGASFSVPPGDGVVEGNVIPYLPAALTKKKQNMTGWLTLDPEIKCYLPGVPRATYQPFPFQILQGTSKILLAYTFSQASRTIYMDKPPAPLEGSWMGNSVGHWEGETLVVDVTNFNDQTWFDRAGNFHSDALHVVERYTALNPNTLEYEATIDDPKTFTRPWKLRMPLYRHLEANARILDYRCVEFSEELLYGALGSKKVNP